MSRQNAFAYLLTLMNFLSAACIPNVTHDPSDNHLPKEWDRVCERVETLSTTDDKFYTFAWPRSVVRILCVLSMGDVLHWEDFRTWARSEATVPVALEITCPIHNAGTVHLPWPMKANNLTYLTVKNCGVHSYYAEYMTAHLLKIKDSIRVLEITDCVIHYLVSEVRLLISNTQDISPDAHCGQLTMEKYVSRNLTYELDYKNDTDIAELSTLLLKNSSAYYTNVQIIPTVCQFKYLRYMDESYNHFLGRKHFFLQQFKSVFPEMRFYNLSNIGLVSIPSELKHWRFKFPRLEYLDLSRNHITSFDFVDYNPDSKIRGVIDLRYNNITQITQKELKTLRLMKSAFVILNNNTLSCECNKNVVLYKHLEKTYKVGSQWKRYDYLSELPCRLDDSHVVPFYHVSREDIFCEKDNTVTPFVTVTLVVVFVVIVVIVVILVRCLKSRQSKTPTVSLPPPNLCSPDIVKDSQRKEMIP